VEHATLRAELKRYKKSLLDSEKAIAELRQDTLGLQDKAKQRFADSKEIERNAQQLQESQERLEQKEDELMTLQENYDRLRLELEDRDKTEEDDATEIDKLRQKVEQLEEEKDDLEADLRAKDQELDEREDKDVGLLFRLLSIPNRNLWLIGKREPQSPPTYTRVRGSFAN